MNEIERLQKKQGQIFILVCINFTFFMILFIGLGYVTWQSAVLVSRLKADLDRAEETINSLKDRVAAVDTKAVVDRLVTSASEQLRETIRNTVEETDLVTPIHQAAERMASTRHVVEKTGEAIQSIALTMEGVDNEEIARLVSYHMLKGLGDGLQEAAETRRPDDIKAQ